MKSIYVWELLVVTIILSTATIAFGGGLLLAEWVGTVSVILTFAHTAAANALREDPDAHLARKYLNVWLISKELSWLIYMFLIGAMAGTTGTLLFMLYPFWRWLYVKNKNEQNN